jgi:hypothetical protein
VVEVVEFGGMVVFDGLVELVELVELEVVVTGIEQPRACSSGRIVEAAAGFVRYVACRLAQPSVVVDVVEVLVLDDDEEDDDVELLDELELVPGIEQPKVCSWPSRMGLAAGLAI